MNTNEKKTEAIKKAIAPFSSISGDYDALTKPLESGQNAPKMDAYERLANPQPPPEPFWAKAAARLQTMTQMLGADKRLELRKKQAEKLLLNGKDSNGQSEKDKATLQKVLGTPETIDEVLQTAKAAKVEPKPYIAPTIMEQLNHHANNAMLLRDKISRREYETLEKNANSMARLAVNSREKMADKLHNPTTL